MIGLAEDRVRNEGDRSQTQMKRIAGLAALEVDRDMRKISNHIERKIGTSSRRDRGAKAVLKSLTQSPL